MPCDLGYKQINKIKIPAPAPQEFKEKIKPPEVDADLLEKIGENDLAFLEWLNDLDIKPLLEKALSAAKQKIGDSGLLKSSIDENGNLIISGSFKNNSEKKRLESATSALSEQFQFEVLKIVAELLDYELVLSKGKNGEPILEGEKDTDSGVHKYLKVTKDKNGNGVLAFEHFASKEELSSEEEKFLGLAQKLGVKISVEETKRSGQPLPANAVHKDFLHHGRNE